MEYVSVFKALGDETRLRIVNLFVQSDQRLCVCEMVDSLQLPQYTISKALGILRHATILRSGRQGTWVYNRLNEEDEFLRSLFEMLKVHLAGKYPEDIGRLHKRLSLRDGDVCVIGVPLGDKLHEEAQKRAAHKEN